MFNLWTFIRPALLIAGALAVSLLAVATIYVEYTTGTIGFGRMSIKVITYCGLLVWLIEKLQTGNTTQTVKD